MQNIILTNTGIFKLTFVLLIGTLTFCSCRSSNKSMTVTNAVTNENKAELENRFLIVNKSRSAHANSNDTSISERVVIALNEVKIRSGKKNIRLTRGDCAVFQFGESYSLLKGDYFEVSIKKNHPKPVKPKVWHEPTKNASVFVRKEWVSKNQIL